MLRSLMCAGLLAVSLGNAGERPRAARTEALPPEKFNQTHAPLFAPKPSREAGGLTERVAAALPPGASQSGSVPRRNYIDEFIFGKLERDRIPSAGLASDEEFLRRATLDLTGRIPTAEDVRAYAANRDPRKRDQLVDRLLDSEAYVDKWAYFFLDLFRANGKMGRGQNLFHYWVKENLRVDRPYDDWARAMISSSAKSNHVVAASNVIAREHVQGKPYPDDGADWGMVHQLDTHDELVLLWGRVFLGVNFSCVACHDGKGHLEKVNVYLSGRKRTDFFQLASFFGNTRYMMYWSNGQPISGEFLIDDAGDGYKTKSGSMIRVPRFGGPSTPKFILTDETPKAGAEPREELARMITSHPQFARASANLLWSRLMTFGIVDPYDEFDLARQDPANLPKGWDLQPSHPELLNAMADDLRRHGYSLRRLLGAIARSNAYALSARFDGEWKESYSRYYARKFVRMLSAEEVHDAIASATSRPGDFKYGGEKMALAMQLSGPGGGTDVRYFMQAFGQSNRSNPPRTPSGSPLQPLVLMNTPVVNERVAAEKDSRVQRLLDSYKQDDARVVEELFLATLSRLPSEREKTIGLEALAASRVNGAQNLQWALINQAEFLFNH